MSVTPLNFYLQRLSLSDPGRHLSAPPIPPAVLTADSLDAVRLQGFMRGRRIRSDCVGVTRAPPADPLLAFYPPRSIPPRSRPSLRSTSSHGLRHELTSPRCCVSYLLCRVSKNWGVIPCHLRLKLPPWAFLSSSRSPKLIAFRTPV